jgi:hypothetical protein
MVATPPPSPTHLPISRGGSDLPGGSEGVAGNSGRRLDTRIPGLLGRVAARCLGISCWLPAIAVDEMPHLRVLHVKPYE